MAEEPGEVSRLLSIHYDQPEEQRKQCSAMNNLTERYGNKQAQKSEKLDKTAVFLTTVDPFTSRVYTVLQPILQT